jgi:acetyltransferase-like isoleucine patch superfamily enzyme
VSISLHIVNKLFRLLPETRCYGFKTRLLGMCGFNIHHTARIVSSARFWGSYELSVGIDTFIGHEVLIAGGNCRIAIGNFCDIGPRASVVAGTHEIDMIGPRSAGTGYSKDIIIENGVWIGANSTILGGVRIGEKAVVAAGSVVTEDIPPYVVAAGVPCRPVKAWDLKYQEWRFVGKEDEQQ